MLKAVDPVLRDDARDPQGPFEVRDRGLLPLLSRHVAGRPAARAQVPMRPDAASDSIVVVE